MILKKISAKHNCFFYISLIFLFWMSNNRTEIASRAGKIRLMISISFCTRDLNCSFVCGSRQPGGAWEININKGCFCVRASTWLFKDWVHLSIHPPRDAPKSLGAKLHRCEFQSEAGLSVGLARAETLTHLAPAFSFSIPLFCYTFLAVSQTFIKYTPD